MLTLYLKSSAFELLAGVLGRDNYVKSDLWSSVVLALHAWNTTKSIGVLETTSRMRLDVHKH